MSARGPKRGLTESVRCTWTRVISIVFVPFWILSWAAYVWAKPGYTVAYPQDYRKWGHVKSALIGPQNPIYARYGGLHHIYANMQTRWPWKAIEAAGFPMGRSLFLTCSRH